MIPQGADRVVPPRDGTADVIHGRTVPDPYRRLEDPADPATTAWIREQQRLYAEARSREPLLEPFRGRLARLSGIAVSSPPRHRGDRVFFAALTPGAERPVLHTARGRRSEVLFDPMAFDPAGRTALDAWEPSWDGARVALQVSQGGTEESSLLVLDTRTGDVIDGPIDRVRRSSIAWLPCGDAFYYVRRLPPGLHPGEERYHRRVYLHRVGTEPDQDTMVFGEGRGATQFYSLAISPDGRLLSVRASAGTGSTADLYIADAAEPGGNAPERPRLTPVQENSASRVSLRLAPGVGASRSFYLITDLDAPRGRIVQAHVNAPTSENWREVIPEDPEAVLTDAVVLGGPRLPRPVLLVLRTRHAVSELSVHDAVDGSRLGEVPLPGAGTAGALRTRPDGGHEAWFGYTDHTTAPVMLRYDAVTGDTAVWQCPEPATADPTPPPHAAAPRTPGIRTVQVACESADGTPVRMFVVSAAGAPDRPRPTILTGYGGFGVSQTPGYSPTALAWAEAGGVYAVACARGGGEEGEQWHEAGRGPNKAKSFEDFEAAADWLVQAGWTTPDQLGLMGNSNGGLLVGAALTRRPEAYAAVVCVAPLLDMVRYELSGMGPSWREEYGTTADRDAFENLLSYSPYHNVREGERYPAVLFAVFDGDTRVDPAHARKMCAALQHASVGAGPILLRTEQDAGHGAREVSRSVGLLADSLGFLAGRLGLGRHDGELPVPEEALSALSAPGALSALNARGAREGGVAA